MKILITTDWYKPVVNGVVTSVINLEQELTAQGHDVRILTLAKEGGTRREGNVYYIKSFDIGKIYPEARATVQYYNYFVRQLIRWNPDVIHSQCELVSFPFARRIAKRCGSPLIHTYHTVYEDYTHYFTRHEGAGRKFVALGSRVILKKVDGVIVPTNKVKHILGHYGVMKDTWTVPTGIDTRKYNQRLPLAGKIEIRRKYGIRPNAKVLVSVGRLAKEKNVQELLHYMARIKETDTTTVLLIVGDGPYMPELQKLAESLKLGQRVIFTGMIPAGRVWQYYQAGDLFVCASRSETQGLTYIEALASGLPAVCREDASIEDVIQNGGNGYQYTGFEEFYDAVNQLTSHPAEYKRASEAARATAERYSIRRFAENLLGIYRYNLFLKQGTYEPRIGMFQRRSVS